MIDLKEIKLKIFHQPCPSEASSELEEVYRLWKRLWSESYIEMGKEKLDTSDTFTRQHEVLALFFQNLPIASVCHRYANLNSDSTYDDSYFKNSWSSKEIDYLKSLKGQALLGSQISIDKKFRKASSGIDLKRLISFISLKYAQYRNIDMILGMMRVDRGMEKVFYEAGANILARDRDYYGVKVDLVAFYPKINPIVIPDQFRFSVDHLLKNSQTWTEYNSEQLLNFGG